MDTDAKSPSEIEYLYRHNEQYRNGYNAACSYEDKDPTAHKDWLAGFNQALIDMSKGE